MTGADWTTTKLPLYMLREYPIEWNQRKVRLFWCACLRRAWDLLVAEWDLVLCERLRRLVESVEQNPANAGGELDPEFEWVRERVPREKYAHAFHRPDWWVLGVFLDTWPNSLEALLQRIADRVAQDGVRDSKFATGSTARRIARDKAEDAEKARQCDLIREVFGNPYRPVAADPSWLTSDVLALARGIYDERAFDRMPILADALQDAGCDHEDVLNHCRGPGEHVRGCWVIDFVVEK